MTAFTQAVLSSQSTAAQVTTISKTKARMLCSIMLRATATIPFTVSTRRAKYSAETADEDIIVTVGESSITLKYAAGKTININGKKYFKPKWILDGKTANYGSMIEVAGVKDTTGLSLKNNVVTISDASLNKSKVTINDDYTLKLGKDVTKSTVKKDWKLSDTTATLVQTTTAFPRRQFNRLLQSRHENFGSD